MVSDTQQIPAGYKQTDVGVIPVDWGVFKLNELMKIYRGGSPRPIQDFLTNRPDGINWIKIGDVSVNAKYILHAEEKIIKEGADHSRRVYAGDFVLSNSMSFGRPYITRISGCVHDGWLVLQDYQNNYDTEFLFYLLSSDQVLRQYKQKAAGSGVLNLNKELVSSVDLLKPSLSEQKKMAKVLSDLDNLILKFDQLIQKKKNIKQGAMQELLTGKRRLPGFSGEWVDTTLGNVVDIRKGQLITSNTIKQGNVPVIAGGKTPAYFHNKANRLGKTITVSASGASAGYVWIHLSAIFASDCSTIEESSNYSIGFIYYWLKLMQEEIYYLQTGGAQPHIHPSDLNPMPILIPRIEEQIAIEQVLSDMDAEIDNLVDKKHKYQDLKQAMMQQLLTGKIRLI
jgi:type I restriction enzyme S subunit